METAVGGQTYRAKLVIPAVDIGGRFDETVRALLNLNNKGSVTTVEGDVVSNENGTLTITADLTVPAGESKRVTGEILWKKDTDYQDLRPVSLGVALLADGKFVKNMQVGMSTSWKFDFGEMPVYDYRQAPSDLYEDTALS